MAQCRAQGELTPVALQQRERYPSLVSCAGRRTLLVTRVPDSRSQGWLSLVRIRHGEGTFGAPVLWAGTGSVAHNAAWLCVGDELTGYGGRDRTNGNAAPSASIEVGIVRVTVPLSAAVRSADASTSWQWRRKLQLNGSHPGCDERRDFWAPICEFDGRLSVVYRPGRVLLYARANTRRVGNGRFVQVASSADGRSNWSSFERIRFACGRPVQQRAPRLSANVSAYRRIGLTRATVLPFAGAKYDLNGVDFGSWRIVDIYFAAVDWHEELGWMTALLPLTYWRRSDASLQGGVFVAHSTDGVVWTTPRKLLSSAVFIDGSGNRRTADHPIATRYSAANRRLYAFIQHNTSVMLDDPSIQYAEGGMLKHRIRPFICRYPLSKALMPPTAAPVDRGHGAVDANCKRVPCCSAASPEPGFAGRCKTIINAHAGCHAPWYIRHCVVACGACAVCRAHPQNGQYATLYPASRRSDGDVAVVGVEWFHMQEGAMLTRAHTRSEARPQRELDAPRDGRPKEGDEEGLRAPSCGGRYIGAAGYEVVSDSTAIHSELSRQRLRPIAPEAAYEASARPIPLEPDLSLTDVELEREFNETRRFLTKQLSKDPRLKPADVISSNDHMHSCALCVNERGHWSSLHSTGASERGMGEKGPLPPPPRNIGGRIQLFVDDYLVQSHQNVLRFLNPPTSQEPILRPTLNEAQLERHINGLSAPPGVNDTRFGCPCSVARAPDGGVWLWHTATPRGAHLRLATHPSECRATDARCFKPDEHAIVRRWSPNGQTNWSAPLAVRLIGKRKFRGPSGSGRRRLPPLRLHHSCRCSLVTRAYGEWLA